MEPIALIGIGCRFPGADHPATFWRLLRDGRDAIVEVPPDRWDAASLHDPDPAAPGKLTTRWGGFVDNIDRFDADFFGLAPREAPFIDPQQRLLLELAWEALEDAGQVPATLAGSATGVFIGSATHDYAVLGWGHRSSISAYTGPGTSASIGANRISYVLDLRGPSIAIDTACSSSLVAVHLACQSLQAGEATLAIAGGVNVIFLPVGGISLSKAGAMAPDGRCKAFDARADGYVRAEGAGIVVLKPLARAVADRDHIYATLLGTATNEDGRTNGLMAPNRFAQEAVVREAWRRAGVSPGLAQYVEAHGTGTLLGDPIEAKALGAVLAEGREPGSRCAIGSVKTNVGHLEAAAGAAGLIKVALMLEHRELVPSLHFETPSPHSPFDRLPIRVVRQVEAWPDRDGRALAGVSSFGFGGSNAHVVLEGGVRQSDELAPLPSPDLLPISARTVPALRALVSAHLNQLTATEDRPPRLRDLCYSAGVRRTHHEWRASFAAASLQELIGQLESWLALPHAEGVPPAAAGRRARPRVAFVFPGQGSQWAGMGRGLLDDPVFRAALDACEEAFGSLVNWRLSDVLASGKVDPRLDAIDVLQPALFAMQVAIAAVWRAWGVTPDAVVGHSMGEVAAAHVAGILSLEDAARVICVRSRLLRTRSGQGAMALVDLPYERVHQALGEWAGRLSVAAANGPRSTVVSGDPAAVADFIQRMERDGIFCRRVNVDVASHSPQMDDLRDELLAGLHGIRPRPAEVTFYSTVTGNAEDGLLCGPEYWARNLRQPTLFGPVVGAMLDAGHDVFVEVSAHPILVPSLEDVCAERKHLALTLASLHRDQNGRLSMLRSLGEYYVHGGPIDWPHLFGGEARLVSLPPYAWQRQRFWLDDASQSWASEAARNAEPARAAEHPLLGPRVDRDVPPGGASWEHDITLRGWPFLADHRVDGAPAVPAAAYVELSLAALAQSSGTTAWVIDDLTFERLLVVDPDTTVRLRVVVGRDRQDQASVSISSRAAAAPAGTDWVRHAHATARAVRRGDMEGADPDREPFEALRSRCTRDLPAAAHYEALERRGLEYGTSFRGVRQILLGDDEALVRVALPTEATSADDYTWHPGLLDAACFQVLGLLGGDDGGTPADRYLPVGVSGLRLYRRPDGPVWAHVRSCRDPAAPRSTGIRSTIDVLDDQGGLLLRADRIEAARVGALADGRPSGVARWFHRIRWCRVSEESAVMPAPAPDEKWLIFADETGVADAVIAALAERGERSIRVVRGTTFRVDQDDRITLDPSESGQFIRLIELLGRGGVSCRGVVYFWSLPRFPEADRELDGDDGTSLGVVPAMYLVQALVRAGWRDAPRVWMLTRGVHRVGKSHGSVAIGQAPLWGFGRVVAQEHPELRWTMIDLDPREDARLAATIAAALVAPGDEDQIAIRSEERFAARLVADDAGTADDGGSTPLLGASLRLEVSAPGRLETLRLVRARRRRPGAGEVELEVRAAGLNFADVLAALAVSPHESDRDRPRGFEVSGRVCRVGPGVRWPRPGDEVIGLAEGAFASHVATRAECLAPRPAALDACTAAAIPIGYLTAYYALHHLGRIQAEEVVLVHAASGATGLAAVAVARRAGATVFATAGTPEKRDFLRGLGIQHVADSRAPSFVEDVRRWTDGRGVDVVFNSLSGRLLDRGFDALAPYGRFLDISKRDIAEHGRLALHPFQRCLSYHAIDVGALARDRPSDVGAILRTVCGLVDSGELPALPVRVFPIDAAEDAFRLMARAGHTGKIVLSIGDGGQLPDKPASSCYLVSGGLGRLGLSVASRLASRGAARLVLVGRSAPTEEARAAIGAIEASGTSVAVVQADVADFARVAQVVAEENARGTPVTGVVHMAGVLDDRTVLRMEPDQVSRVMAPKVRGAWNLHRATRDQKLEFFCLYSSAASVLGSPGQANYAAANAFLDALAHYRRGLGLPAIAINWGPFSGDGLAAEPHREGRLALRGVGSMSPDQGLDVLDELLASDRSQVCVVPLDLRQWRQFYPKTGNAPLLAALANGAADAMDGQADAAAPFRAELAARPESEQAGLLEIHLRGHLARVLGRVVSAIEPNTPLSALGLDSLMALELRNGLERSLGLSLPATLVWTHPDVESLALYLVRRMGFAPETATAGTVTAGTAASDGIAARIWDLSDSEAEALMAKRLGSSEARP